MGLFYSKRLQKILDFDAPELAKQSFSQYIEPEHILSIILQQTESLAFKILLAIETSINMEDNIPFLQKKLTELIEKLPHATTKTNKTSFLSPNTTEVLALAEETARIMMSDVIGTEHFLLGLLKLSQHPLKKILQEIQVTFDNAQETLYNILGIESDKGEIARFFETDPPFMDPEDSINTYKKQKILPKFSINLNQLAKKGKLDPVIGRNNEINRVLEILSRRTKNNPILIGEPGVGKTAIVEGIAQRIVNSPMLSKLNKKIIYILDLASIVAGSKYRGEFEERIKKIVEEVSASKNSILFIDEFHTIIGAGAAEGTLDAANILKPALARGELQIIGATTLNEYKKYIEHDKALERRMQPVPVNEPTREETIEILNGLKTNYEKFHHIIYSKEAIIEAVDLSIRFITERFLPDKAIDLLDEAGAKARNLDYKIPEIITKYKEEIKKLEVEKKEAVEKQNFEQAIVLRDKLLSLRTNLKKAKENWEKEAEEHTITITKEHIQKIISLWLHIPLEKVSESEGKRLLKMEHELSKKLIGQNHAIATVSNVIRRSRVGLQSHKRPIGSFIFLGPTGVGKTLLAKVIAEFLFGNEDKLIRIDMSDFMEKFSVSRLVGAPPGYIGYEEGGLLTEKVRKNPYSVILFDEIEKAHPDVFHILLQILEEGELADNLGNIVNFRNTLIILTSNIGSKEMNQNTLGFEDIKNQIEQNKTLEHNMKKSLKKLFNPEFLNRIDHTIIFNKLTRRDIGKILEKELKIILKNLKKNKIFLTVDKTAKNYLIEKSFNDEAGARQIRRILQTEIEDRVAIAVLENSIKKNNKFFLIKENNSLILKEKEIVTK